MRISLPASCRIYQPVYAAHWHRPFPCGTGRLHQTGVHGAVCGEIPGNVVFTIETSVCTPLQAVYQFTGLEKRSLRPNPEEYDRRHFLERMKKYSGIDGPVTKQDLPKINPLKISDMKRKMIPKINSVSPYYIIYEGIEQNIAHKNSL